MEYKPEDKKRESKVISEEAILKITIMGVWSRH